MCLRGGGLRGSRAGARWWRSARAGSQDHRKMDPVIPQPGSQDDAPLRIAYVLGTTAGGTGPHVAMLAQGCAARGMTVRVFGPAETGRRYFPGQHDPDAGGTGSGPGEPPGFTAVAIG